MGKDKKHKKGGKHGAKGNAAASKTEALAKQGSRSLAQTDAMKTVGGLERALLKRFPAATAEPWDRTGLLVGDRAVGLTKVAITLDPTVDAIKQAAEAGANVLLTHHPAYLDAPDSFSPEPSVALCSGAGVWAAIERGVALMDLHTALDVSKQAQVVLPKMLGLAFTGDVLEPLEGYDGLGYGQICTAGAEDGKPESLAHLAARCTSVFGRAPRAWGSPDARIRSVVTATGSAGNLKEALLARKIDCLICGELKYHEALDLAEAGVAILELGHDASEFPLTAVLADAVAGFGVDPDKIIILDQAERWWHPESIRI